MIQNEDVAVVKDEKDSSTVIMKKSDHAVKLCTMTDGGNTHRNYW